MLTFIFVQIAACVSFPFRSSVEIVEPLQLETFLLSKERVIVEFSSRVGGIYGTSALTGMVFKDFAASSEDTVCVRCLDKTKSGIEPVPFLPPLYVMYLNGQNVGHCSGYTTSGMFKELVSGAHDGWLEVGPVSKPEPQMMGSVKAFS